MNVIEEAITDENLVTFESFGLRKEIMQSINLAGFKTPSPIQQMVIPVIMEGRDVVGQAHTGTGKTAAFGLPALNKMHLKGGIEALIITPTRELANQVGDEIFKYGTNTEVFTVFENFIPYLIREFACRSDNEGFNPPF